LANEVRFSAGKRCAAAQMAFGAGVRQAGRAWFGEVTGR
jgi:hypothetical protein